MIVFYLVQSMNCAIFLDPHNNYIYTKAVLGSCVREYSSYCILKKRQEAQIRKICVFSNCLLGSKNIY